MEKLKKGFYTAIGTPLLKDGSIDKESLEKEINMQIDAGASGLLLMGSMGMEASVPDKAYVDAVHTASAAVGGRVPLFVGAMDNSAQRVIERIERVKDCPFTAAVVTTPFYFANCEAVHCDFFEMIADKSDKPIFLYDLPGVTKCKITFDMVKRLAKHENIKGIKSGDMALERLIKQNIPEFEVLYSNIDCFDAALSFGLDKVLDGMFSSTPKNAEKFIKSAQSGDMDKCAKYLNNILLLRDTYAKHGVMQGFTVSMNLLGMEGNFAPDYFGKCSSEGAAEIEKIMREIGEL